MQQRPTWHIPLLMHNFMANEVRILEICKDFSENRANALSLLPSLSDRQRGGPTGIGEIFLLQRFHWPVKRSLAAERIGK